MYVPSHVQPPCLSKHSVRWLFGYFDGARGHKARVAVFVNVARVRDGWRTNVAVALRMLPQLRLRRRLLLPRVRVRVEALEAAIVPAAARGRSREAHVGAAAARAGDARAGAGWNEVDARDDARGAAGRCKCHKERVAGGGGR